MRRHFGSVPAHPFYFQLRPRGTRRITDEMFMSAALALARLVTEPDLKQGSLYPALPRIREVSAHIAAAVAQVAYSRGLAVGQAPDDRPGRMCRLLHGLSNGSMRIWLTRRI